MDGGADLLSEIAWAAVGNEVNLADWKVRLRVRSGRRQTFDSEQARQFRLHRRLHYRALYC